VTIRKLIVVEMMSLDGVIQAPDGAKDVEVGFAQGGWASAFASDVDQGGMTELYRESGAFLFGRITYDIFASYWPKQGDESSDYARAMNHSPKYVVSTTSKDKDAMWKGTTIIKRDVAGKLRSSRRSRANTSLSPAVPGWRRR